jgi:hypothetical protein
VVAERAEDEVESRLLMFNHTVEHIFSWRNVNRVVECRLRPAANQLTDRGGGRETH